VAPDPISPDSTPPERVGYFLVQVRSHAGPLPQVGVVLEDLHSGAKHRFDTARAVGDYLDGWARTSLPQRIP